MPSQMQLPSERVRDVLAVLGDLKPAEARALLSEVVATLDAAELCALRTMLPPQATKYLPHCVGAATVMNTDPMPWEFVEPISVVVEKGPTTGEIIAATLPHTEWKPRLVAAGAIALTVLTVFLQWPAPRPVEIPPEPELAEPMPAKKPFAEIPMVPAATARPARKPELPERSRGPARKTETRTAARPLDSARGTPASDLKRPAEAGAPAPKKTAGAQKSAPNEWASPFERRQ